MGCSGGCRGENFLKHGLKQGILVYSEQTVKGGDGHQIWTLLNQNLNMRAQSNFLSLYMYAVLQKQAENHGIGTLMYYSVDILCKNMQVTGKDHFKFFEVPKMLMA